MDTIKIVDMWVDDKWYRKVGAGEWKLVDLSPYAGRVPVVVAYNGPDGTVVETELTKEEAGLRGLLGPARTEC